MTQSANKDTSFSVVPYESKTEELFRVEVSAGNALRKIQSLYEEIMTPRKGDDEFINSYAETDEPREPCYSPSYLEKMENQPKQAANVCSVCRNTMQSRSFKNRKKPNVCFHEKPQKDDSSLHLNSPSVYKHKITRVVNQPIKITTPKPFTLSMRENERKLIKEQKIDKLKEELNRPIEEELKVKIQTKPVPKHTHLPVFKNMMEESEKRKLERKEKSAERVQSVVKPFNLNADSRITKSKSAPDLKSEQNLYRAKPIPRSILSKKIDERLKNKEQIRKIIIAERAQESLRHSTLPFSKKKFNRSYSLLDLTQFNKNNITYNKTNNFSDMSKKEYSKKCRETMENWNKKVTMVAKTKDSSKPKQPEIKSDYVAKSKLFVASQSLPFYNYPVRMSNAALMREKQVRKELAARKLREAEMKSVEEEKARKEKETKRQFFPKLQSFDPTSDSRKNIHEKTKIFRASQINREQEYQKELQEIMERVSNQLLLIERQSKRTKETSYREGSDYNERFSERKSSVDSGTYTPSRNEELSSNSLLSE